MAYIKKFWLGCCETLGNLPTTYQNSLSYIEQLLLLNKKLNEVIDIVNQFELDTIQDMINSAINELKNYVDNQDEKLYNYIDTEIQNVKNYTNEQIEISQNYLITLINEKFLYLLNYINSNDNLIRQEIQDAISYLEDKINHITFDKLEIIDPTLRSLK